MRPAIHVACPPDVVLTERVAYAERGAGPLHIPFAAIILRWQLSYSVRCLTQPGHRVPVQLRRVRPAPRAGSTRRATPHNCPHSPQGVLRSAPTAAQARGAIIRIREITDASDPALSDAYALLKRSFHREERVLLREWKGSLQEGASRLLSDVAWHLLVAEQDDAVIGLASGTYLGNVNLGVIGYLAITPAARARGVGTRLRARLRSLFARDARRLAGRELEAIVGEVSEENPWLQTLARRPEVLLLDFPYFQPRLHANDLPSPFILYYESLRRRRDRIPVSELRRVLYTIWRRVYRVSRPLERPAFRAMLRALEHRRAVGRRKPHSKRAP